jgi:hypothetical protein
MKANVKATEVATQRNEIDAKIEADAEDFYQSSAVAKSLVSGSILAKKAGLPATYGAALSGATSAGKIIEMIMKEQTLKRMKPKPITAPKRPTLYKRPTKKSNKPYIQLWGSGPSRKTLGDRLR